MRSTDRQLRSVRPLTPRMVLANEATGARRCAALVLLACGWAIIDPRSDALALEVGGYVQNINPQVLPVTVNGGFVAAVGTRVVDPLAARTLVIRSDETVVAITLVDSCLLPRDLVDESKRAAAIQSGIPAEHMLVAATHAHSTPAVQGIHGTEASPAYRAQLRAQLTQSIVEAYARLQPAQVGWGRAPLDRYIYCRRWHMQPGTALTLPLTGRSENLVQMNPGHGNPHKIRPVGPVDPDVVLVAFRTPEGRPLAALGNFNTHYAGAPPLSADYFGHFCRKLAGRLDADASQFVALMSNGTSGDANCIDYRQAEPEAFTAADVADAVLERAEAIFHGISQWHDSLPLAMLQRELVLNVRMPSAEEANEAQAATAAWIDERLPASAEEVYARETLLLTAMPPQRRAVLQTLRLGELAIAATPCEVYGATGLAIKRDSPFPTTMNISLANDYLGYLPPEDQFALGGYTTWRARSSCLEERAEAKVRAELQDMLQALRQADADGPVEGSAARP